MYDFDILLSFFDKCNKKKSEVSPPKCTNNCSYSQRYNEHKENKQKYLKQQYRT